MTTAAKQKFLKGKIMNDKECKLLMLPNNYRIDFFKNNISDLKNIDFVFFDCLKSNASLFCSTEQYSTIEILQLADYEHMFLLNKDTYDKLDTKIRINTEVLFDSNVFGKLKINEAWNGDIAKLKKELNSKQIATNAIPFILERTLNEYDFEQDMKYKFYEDFKYYFKEFNNNADESNISIMADNAYGTFFKMRHDSDTRLIGNMQHFASYAYLLMTYILYNKISSVDDRIRKFVEFINTQIYVYLELTANLCVNFLINGSKSIYAEFFKYFQLNYSNYEKLIKNIKGMAWDLTLVYNSMRTFATNYRDYNSLKLIYFATADRQLAKIIKNNQIKSLSIINGEISQMYFDRGLQELEINDVYKKSIAEFSDMRKYNFEKMNKEELRIKLEDEVKLFCSN